MSPLTAVHHVVVLLVLLLFTTNAFVVRPSWTTTRSRPLSVITSVTPLTPLALVRGDPEASLESSTSLASSVVEADAFALATTEAPPVILTTANRYEYEEQEASSPWKDLSMPPPGTMSLQNPSVQLARGLILAASAVYGTNFAVVKMLDEQMPFAVSAALRFGLAAAVVSALVLRGEQQQQQEQQHDDRGPATWAGMEIGGWYCLGYLCQAIGLQTADASKSAFFNALAVIVVPLLDSFLRGKQLGIKGVSSVALAILGVGLLQLGPSLLAGAPLDITPGDAFCLGQAALFGIGYWRLEDVSSQYATQAGRITVGQLVGVALGTALFCGVTEGLPTLTQLQGWLSDGFTVGALVWTALVSTALALYLETVALKAVSATELTVLMTSVSLFGSAFAYVTMGETMSPIGMMGGLLILAGCIFSSLGGTQTPELDENKEWLADSLILEEDIMASKPAFVNNTTITLGLYR